MHEATLAEGRQDVTAQNPYKLAGWLALAQAVLFPVGIYLGVVQQILSIKLFDYRGPVIGPADGLLLLFTIFAVYTLWRLKALLNERYDFHAVDTPIQLMIAWVVLNQIVSMSVDGFAIATGAEASNPLILVMSLGLMVIFMLSAGILDIFIAVRLLRAKDELGDTIKVFAIVTLIAGILEATVFLSPLAALMVPISCVILALIFLKDPETAEFV